MAVFNDPPPGKRPRVKLGYGTAKRARDSIRRLKKEPLSYQVQASHTLYARAKYHKHQTEGMRNAMRIYGQFLQTLKREGKSKSKSKGNRKHKGRQPSKQ
jgi:hypothetical protein